MIWILAVIKAKYKAIQWATLRYCYLGQWPKVPVSGTIAHWNTQKTYYPAYIYIGCKLISIAIKRAGGKRKLVARISPAIKEIKVAYTTSKKFRVLGIRCLSTEHWLGGISNSPADNCINPEAPNDILGWRGALRHRIFGYRPLLNA